MRNFKYFQSLSSEGPHRFKSTIGIQKLDLNSNKTLCFANLFGFALYSFFARLYLQKSYSFSNVID